MCRVASRTTSRRLAWTWRSSLRLRRCRTRITRSFPMRVWPRGPVLSVKLYFRVPPGEVRALALDEGSRTSAALSRILLAERFGVEPRPVAFPLGSATSDIAADAILMIGDRAMHAPAETFLAEWDLGAEWYRWTGLPFVFAMWITREGVQLGGVDRRSGPRGSRGVANRRDRRAGSAGPRTEHIGRRGATCRRTCTSSWAPRSGTASSCSTASQPIWAWRRGRSRRRTGRRGWTAVGWAVPTSWWAQPTLCDWRGTET